MGDAKAMLEASPSALPLDVTEVATAIEACLNSSQTCTACADSDLAEPDVAELRTCIGLCLTCADVCAVTARLLSRPGAWEQAVIDRLLQACVRTCASCAQECARHAAHHVHCAICERSCRACEAACRALLDDEALEQLRNLAGG
jgi:hypothetical protein